MSAPRSPTLRGLHAIVDVGGLVPLEKAPVVIDALLEGGATVVQIRAKTMPDRDLLALATETMRRLPPTVRLIVNDRSDIAHLAHASGVHLGQEDLPVALVRGWLPRPFVVGLSCHFDHEAIGALESGLVDYIGYGPVFETTTKVPHSPTVGIERLRAISARVRPLPVIAIGGISLDRVREVMEAGASGVAMASALTRAPCIREATNQVVKTLKDWCE